MHGLPQIEKGDKTTQSKKVMDATQPTQELGNKPEYIEEKCFNFAVATMDGGGGRCPLRPCTEGKQPTRWCALALPGQARGGEALEPENPALGSGSGGCVLWEPLALPRALEVQGQGQGEARFGKMQGAGNDGCDGGERCGGVGVGKQSSKANTVLSTDLLAWKSPPPPAYLAIVHPIICLPRPGRRYRR